MVRGICWGMNWVGGSNVAIPNFILNAAGYTEVDKAESEEDVAYAIGYGDGGFGQLTPGLLKITGDLATGEIGGFEYLSTNF